MCYLHLPNGVTGNHDFNISYKTKRSVSLKEDLEVIFNNNATIIKDNSTKAKAVVKKCNLDKADDHKAVLYALAKLHGYTARDIERLIKNAKDFRK